MKTLSPFLLVLAFALTLATAHADDSAASAELRISADGFNPHVLQVPAGKPLVVKVVNSSTEPVEFESFKLHRERAIEPGQTVSVRLPALSPGSYDFFDDFHQKLPEGSIVAK